MLWGVGYAVVWLGKWILAWIFTGYNYFKEAIGQAERYTSDHATWEVENPTLIDRLVKNVNLYMKWPFLMMAIILLPTPLGQYGPLVVLNSLFMLPVLTRVWTSVFLLPCI